MELYVEIEGKPVLVKDVLTWGKYFESVNRIVKQTEIDKVRISTVFLGIDHNHDRYSVDMEKYQKVKRLAEEGVDGEKENAMRILEDMDRMMQPLVYETMIFGGEHDQWCDRYPSREEAIAGHEAAVNLVNQKLLESKDD